ncbi:UNVERIFIED_CONTAM: BRCA1-associated ATM activator 1 [Siphonaria sp. JEL0065]|nr:BRCA1-associated ATM activator 1 [Siphonaria sp. JEL0065]
MFVEDGNSQLRTVLNGLPAMSPEIADPSRHEKVLSYLKDQIRQLGSHRLVSEFNAFKVIEDCLKSSDIRLLSLAFRFLGCIIEAESSSNVSLFNELIAHQSCVLENVLELSVSLNTPSPLIYGCVSMLASFCNSTSAAKWLVKSNSIAAIFWRAFADDSIYVATALTSLLKTLITRPKPLAFSSDCTLLPDEFLLEISHHELLISLIISGNLMQILSASLQNQDWRQYAACLEDQTKHYRIHQNVLEKKMLVVTLLWELCTLNDRGAAKFLKDSGLFGSAGVSLAKVNPLIRIIGKALSSGEVGEDVKLANWYVCLLLSGLGNILQQLETSGDIGGNGPDRYWTDEMMLELLSTGRLDDGEVIGETAVNITKGYLSLLHTTLAFGGLDNKNVMKKRQIQRERISVMTELYESLGDIIHGKRGMIAPANLTGSIVAVILAPLTESCFQSSSKVQRVSLNNLLLLVDGAEVTLPFASVQSIVLSLISLLEDSDQSQSIVTNGYRIIAMMFKFDSFSPLLESDLGALLAESISTRIYALEWDIRDATVDFVASLFSGVENEKKAEYGLQFIQPLLKRCGDAEPNVRFKVLAAFQQAILGTNIGWNYMNMANALESLVTSCLKDLLNDSEALVRRGAVDLLASLVSNPEFDLNHVLAPVEKYDFKISQHKLKKLVSDDSDWEVRVRALSLLGILIERLAIAHDTSFSWIFQESMLIDATVDSSRVVRTESILVITKILAQSQHIPHPTYIHHLKMIDLQQVLELSQIEHIYEEALEVGKSLIQEHDPLNEGNNVMHCYDC